MVSAYALILTSNFFDYDEKIKQAIITAKHGSIIESIRIELWNSYYQEQADVLCLTNKSILRAINSGITHVMD